MKRNLFKNKQKNLTDRAASIIWACLLLAPFIIIAGKNGKGLLFHSLLFFSGWHAWSFTEYFLHRFIMHNATQGKGLGKLFDHAHHHQAPNDIHVKSAHRAILIFTCLLFAAFSWWMNNYCTLLLGYLTGLTGYAFIHFLLHQSWSEKIFPRLHKAHIHHHCKHPDKHFGVISTGWDYLFNTVPVNERVITIRIKRFYYSLQEVNNKEMPEGITTQTN